MEIRRLAPDDVAAWIALREALWPEEDVASLRREAGEILGHPERCAVFLAYDDERPLGMAEATLRDDPEGYDGRLLGYLEAWYVVPDERRHGVGRGLLGAVERWAADRGCAAVASDTETTDTTSRNAHAALGFTAHEPVIRFRKELR